MRVLERLFVLGVVIVFASCRSVAPSDLDSLASVPAAPYSVKVTGGAFIEPARGEGPLARTFGTAQDQVEPFEAISLDRIVRSLEQARVFARVAGDQDESAVRALFARRDAVTHPDAEQLRGLFERAAAEGHDYVLFVDRLADGPVHEHGVNSRWPITAIAWVLLGIGMVIPDHTFESRARLHVALRDVHSGEEVYRRLFDGDPVDLALIDRSNLWGIVQSILIPPFWVANDDRSVVDEVRRSTSQRLLFVLAQDLKSAGCVDELRAAAPVEIDVEPVAGGVRVRCGCVDGLSFVRLSVDERGYEHAAFAQGLLDSVRFESGKARYDAVCPKPASGRFLRILVQTIGGGVASTTVDLERFGEGGI